MFGVLSGRVGVSIFSENGQKFFAGSMASGCWFGEVPLLDETARAFHAEDTERTEVAVLRAQAFWQIVNAHPAMLLAVTRLVCSRYRQAMSWIEDASLKRMAARLASRLLALAEVEAETPCASIRFSQEELAAQLGVARQSANRQLKGWERVGAIRIQYASVQLMDRSVVEAAARLVD